MPSGFGDDDDSEDGDVFARQAVGAASDVDSDADEIYRPDDGKDNDVFGQMSEYEHD